MFTSKKYILSFNLVFYLLTLSLKGYCNNDFNRWKLSYIARAAKRGLPKSFVEPILKDITIDDSVLYKDKNQVILDRERDYHTFIKTWLREGPSRIEAGKELLKKHSKLLQKIEDKYNVEKEAIVALWGIETFYGQITGSYDLIRSLSTLAFDGRRSQFFELQLNAALRLIKQGHAKRDKLKGSWAGATGQCQFMPSNIKVFAQDFDGDGRKDVWTSLEDVFASIAHFLHRVGWQKGKSIGTLAIRPSKIEIDPNKYYSKSKYNQLGFKTLEGHRLSGNWLNRKMAEIPLKNSPVILKGSNYKPLVAWNNSSLFVAFNIILYDAFKKKP